MLFHLFLTIYGLSLALFAAPGPITSKRCGMASNGPTGRRWRLLVVGRKRRPDCCGSPANVS